MILKVYVRILLITSLSNFILAVLAIVIRATMPPVTSPDERSSSALPVKGRDLIGDYFKPAV